ncbi:hypothetical protein SDRG_01417 [Saprolegnia diclina VS20]|uniref:Uncharacterized protein n=1 Tax=Saprolegnia diclina (strain VS20) TaxID=1156394 RepID=T0QTH1_SAPDV|nr:hypothetical protein SDRG_01417 [Saprolegnia diclina VS20]EQC41449.1 hypothetical protein SDRG_01417 [Saprolegnia diclina VS20]|eukprot:XP_008605163.1 hypothetical protein SDRG_01417 [Saprolegnia diclina VS20]
MPTAGTRHQVRRCRSWAVAVGHEGQSRTGTKTLASMVPLSGSAAAQTASAIEQPSTSSVDETHIGIWFTVGVVVVYCAMVAAVAVFRRQHASDRQSLPMLEPDARSNSLDTIVCDFSTRRASPLDITDGLRVKYLSS